MKDTIKQEPANAGSPSPKKKVKKAKKKNYYFTEETEEKLIEYLKEEDQYIKNRIFDRYLHYPFYKMAENLIHTFKFYYTDGLEDLEDLKHELVIFFHGKLDKFNPDNGKAFSYYSLAGKRWLIN
jgi:DNA-directed RNA polymerase specialized sigma subunit